MPSEAQSTNTLVTTALTTSEVIVANLTLQGDSPAGQGVNISGVLDLLDAATADNITIRVRQNSLTGTVIGSPQAIPLTVSVENRVAFDYTDFAPQASTPVSQPTYVVTAQLSAGTATANAVTATATTLSLD